MHKDLTFLAVICIMVIALSGTVSAVDVNTTNTTPLSNYSNIYVQVANDGGVSFNTTGNGTYYIQSLSSPNGGFNAVHIANDSTATTNYGGSTSTTNQSGTFYATDTGGRGYQDDVVLMLAVNKTIPDDFAVTITASGYNWTPSGTLNSAPSHGSINDYGVTLNETFYKSDFIYGPQSWKPTGGNVNYPIYIGEDMNDTSNAFYIMFIDLHAGLLGSNYKSGSNSQFINNGAVQINYTFTNLQSLAAFNIYAWNYNTTQGQGMLWTNSILPGNTGGPSGYTVMGSSNSIADFSTNVTSGIAPLTVQFTDESTGAKPLTYSWDFGDGTTSTQQNPVHTYNNAGNYTVKLTVNNSYGSDEKTSTIIVSVLEALANIPTGLYNNSQTVNLTTSDQEDPNPQIYYTLNGSDPTTNSTLYSGPINITNEGINTLKFRAFDIYGYSSDVVTMVYTLDTTAPTVTASPSGGTYHTTQNVTLTSTDASSTTTYYTTDNTDPRSSKTRTVYSSPIALHTSTLLQFAAIDAAGNWSPLYAQNYTMMDIAPPVPSVDLPSGHYSTDQVAKLSAVDELDANPQIYYTLDGTNPTTNSTLYTWPVSINIVGTTVLKVITVDAAGHISDVLTRIYSLDKPASSGTWNSTIIGSNVMYNSIVMDAAGYPHIAYYQNANSGTDYPDLKYAYEDVKGWHIETVESVPPGSGYYVSLALDSSGNPHIVYKQQFGDGYLNMLKYAYRDATGWHISILTTGYAGNPIGDDIIYCNLVLYQNQPRISFYNYTGGKIEYMYNDGTKWITESIASTGGPWNSIAVDSSGNPKISYYSISPSSGMASLRYAKRTATGAWQVTIVDNSAENVGAWNSIALDSSGNPSISYIYNDGSLRYAYWNGTQWNSEIVDALASSSCKLILNPSNSPIIIYRDSTSSNLKYAYKEGSKWITHNIDTGDGASLWDSLALNSQGVPYVSYESKNSYLKYAYLIPFNASANPTGGTFNKTQTVTLTSTPGTSIYYTTDGSDPRTSSTKTAYSSSITVNNTTTIKFAAVDPANNWGSIYTQTYIINPTVKSVDPVNNAVNVAINKVIKVTFNEVIKKGTGWIELTNSNGVDMPITWSINGSVLTVTANSTLNRGVKYTLLIHTGSVTNMAGDNVTGYVSRFTTSTDSVAPTVKVVDPANNAVNVAADKVIKVTFSEAIQAGNGSIELTTSNGTVVPSTWSISGNVLTIKANSSLTHGVKYMVLIHTGSVTDLAGNNVKGYVFRFTVDTVVPTVKVVDPANNAVNVAADKVIKVTFSEAIKAGNGSIELTTSNGTVVPSTWSISGNVLTIKANSSLTHGVKYMVLIHTGSVTDLAGNNVAGYVSRFTVDTVVPTVKVVDPANNAVNVATSKVIKVTFNEAIAAGTKWIELVASNGTSVTVNSSISGNVLTITPTSALSKGVKYTLLIHTGSVTDLAGNNVAGYVSRFNTIS